MGRTHSTTEVETAAVRLDKWLWAARFFKTRGLATEAIAGGHVQVNDARVKPSRPVKPGDRLTIRKGQTEWEVIVEGIAARRGPASEAQQLYRETEASRLRRESEAEQHRLAGATAPRPERRPDKRARRHIIQFKGNDG